MKNVKPSGKASQEHISIGGITGLHKTISLFYYNLLSEDINENIIIPNPKIKLYKLTSNYQRSIGRIPILFNLIYLTFYIVLVIIY